MCVSARPCLSGIRGVSVGCRILVCVCLYVSVCGPAASGPVRLKNVHQGLPPSGIQGGHVHLVQGVYEYCHYMQDKFDDNGW